jgi:L-fuculose-phosphate aldolase
MAQQAKELYTPETARADLTLYGRKLAEKGLVAGPGGNTSARVGDVVYMKASGAALEDATEEDYIGVSLKTGDVVDGSKKPSCEILMHLGIYLARQDVNAVVHTHAPLSIGVASTGKTIPPMFPDFVGLLGREIALVPYIIPAGSEMANAVVAAIRGHVAVLMANHGVVTVGWNVREAYFRTLVVEDAAKTYLAALTAGTPHLFTEKEVYDVDHLGAEDYRRALLRGEVG